MSSSLRVTIDKHGVIKIDNIKGVFGAGCKKITESLKREGKVLKEKETDDFYKDDPKQSIRIQK